MAEDVNSPAVEFNITTDDLSDAPYTKSLLSHAHPEVSILNIPKLTDL